MNLKQLKAKGGIVDSQPIKKEVSWTHLDGKSGKEVTDTFILHIRRQSFGVIERLFVQDESEQSRNANYIAASVSLGADGTEALSHDDAYNLEPSLGFLLLNAVNEVNGTGGHSTKN
ncbi:phage tail assembly chaperone family protein, TAC [Pseudomonas sp. SWRI153]|uniref:Phage tail assembly chaperone family protein, TAC n=1 Tax=Pseudomonas khorasanensis TaxID=2745508 RepID=A0A923F682_9PSED|nr:phage tail assembly chaperone family protein, TAC [Pseudomonas khorasanensis]MBV4486955.1 phage tail assembly chaperone family protein, TAC [Pseudomonas khorasanensis]